MIKVGLPSALVYGHSKHEALYHMYSNVYHEENLQERVAVYIKSDSKNFTDHFAKTNPDVIITIGGTRESWEWIVKESGQPSISFRWIHYSKEQDDVTMANDIVRQGTYNSCSTKSLPDFSVFTGAYKTSEDRIHRSYKSLVAQTHQNWEWVIVDDSPNEHGETWEILNKLAETDYRVKPHRIFPVSGGNIGEVKNRAASLSNGKWLIEMDHDDALLPTLMEECIKGAEQYPDTGFIYTNPAEPYEDGTMRQYTKTIGDKDTWYANPKNTFVWAYGGHRYTEHEGIKYVEHVYPGINPKTIRFNIGMPNHARIWRKDVYDAIGRHNKFISVADDYELIVRTFLNTKMLHINKMLYLQYNNRNSTVDNNGTDINRKSRLIKEFYDRQIKDRFVELGVEDWEWNESDGRSNLFVNDVDRLKYFEKESKVNYTIYE